MAPPHPLELFRHCPRCGSAAFAVHDPKSKACGACGFVYYMNVAAATVALIVDAEGRLLVARRAREPARGTLDLPGGFCDIGETLEEGLAREVAEETGLAVRRARLLFTLPNRYVYSGLAVPTLDAFFACDVAGGPAAFARMRPADDVAELLWVPLRAVDPAQFGLASIRDGVARFLRTRGCDSSSSDGTSGVTLAIA